MINASDIEAFEYYNNVDNGEVLPTDYQTFIHQSRYSKWMPEEKKRENWRETVQRYMDNIVDGKVSPEEQLQIEDAIINLEVMPSMRAMMTAGPAATVVI
jgi:ribonucleoside-diphosphate reductase alpha chain